MKGKWLLTEKKDGVCNITHERPPMNFLSIESMKEFIGAIREAESDPDVKVITIRGGGDKYFSAGVDVSDHKSAKEMADTFGDLLNAAMYGDKPKISVVKGYALGGGCELISFCDIVYASEKALFGQPEINVGVFPAPAVAIFPKLIGLKKTHELILTGDLITAAEAEKIGLINKVLPAEELEGAVDKLTKNLCSKSSVVLQLTRKAILKAKEMDLGSSLKEAENIYQNELMKTEDAHIGIESFLAQQKPVWKNK